MKKLFENWRKVLQEQSREEINKYVGLYKPGMLRMFHYTGRYSQHSKGETMVIDPSKFSDAKTRRNYSRSEYEQSAYDRSFYYLDLGNTESLVVGGSALFYVDVPAEKIFNWQNYENREPYLKKHRHPVYSRYLWSDIFRDLHQDYLGIHYNLGYGDTGQPIVVCFDPLEATKTTEEEQSKLLMKEVKNCGCGQDPCKTYGKQ